ncbi:MAG: hypothetical protein IJ438_05765 [Clostridia bacterium]|nr:hypothetical protein [Clostridia bacterium]
MKIRSKNRFSDTLTVTSGKKSMSLAVDVDLLTLSTALRKAKETVAQAQIAAAKEPTEANMAAMGQALQGLIVCVFGEEQAEKCIDFYEGRAESMLDDLMPYILRRIAPMAARISARRRRELEKTARRNARHRK